MAFGASAAMSLSTVLSSPGSWALISASSASMVATQLLVELSTHVSMVELKPTSLPPMVIDTSVVDVLSADSWLAMTVPVVAPEQATDA